MEKELLLSCEHIFKSFGVTRALSDVSVQVYRGEIRGLIGENGSGKSTLSSIIAGVQPCDRGSMRLDGAAYKPSSMLEAQNLGVSMVVQEAGTIPGITVAANIFVGKEGLFKKGIGLQVRKMNAAAQEILDRIGAGHIQSAQMIDQLNFEDRKLVEIARAVYTEPELFIVDETTTALSQVGRTIIYKIMKELCAKNKAVLFISHDLDELMEVCNAITVLRDGVLITTMDQEHMSIEGMRTSMVGRELTDNYYRSDYDGSFSDEVVLRVTNVTNGPILENFSFELHKGEILGFGGLSECGMHELGRAVFGADPILTGKVELADGTLIRSPKEAIANKIAYAPKNRDTESIILNDSIRDNIVLPSLQRLSSHGYIAPGKEKKQAEEGIRMLSIKCQGGEQMVSQLSGGNKQKVVFAKWMMSDPDILIFDCPTRGIDIGVKVSMYRQIYDLKKQGKAIIMISEELPELIGMSDRIMILKDGKLAKTFSRSAELAETDIIHYMI